MSAKSDNLFRKADHLYTALFTIWRLANSLKFVAKKNKQTNGLNLITTVHNIMWLAAWRKRRKALIFNYRQRGGSL